MRDFRVIQPDDPETEWILDIDVLNPWLERDSFTIGQRAAIAAFMAQGSVPGMLGIGIQWSDYLSNQTSDTYVKVDNQMRQQVQAYAFDQAQKAAPEQYIPFAAIGANGELTTQVIRQ